MVLPENAEHKQLLMKAFSFDEVQLIYKLYNSLCHRSLKRNGIEKSIFISFSDLESYWGARFFKFVKSCQQQQQRKHITF